MGTAQKVTLFEISYTAHVDFFRDEVRRSQQSYDKRVDPWSNVREM